MIYVCADTIALHDLFSPCLVNMGYEAVHAYKMGDLLDSKEVAPSHMYVCLMWMGGGFALWNS